MLKAKTKRNILRIIPFGIIWFLFSVIYLFLEKGILGDAEYYPSTGNPYEFYSQFLTTTISSTVTGLLIGIFEIFFLNKVFKNISFSKKIIYKAIFYILIIIIFLLFNTFIANAIETGKSISDPELWGNVLMFFSDFAFWSIVLYGATIIGVTMFYLEVSDNIGQNELFSYFTGKYHQPVEEERIFMFLDMKSSTTIAEKLGHVKYFELLREYYADLSDPIIQFSGEIYQYVGDEIVVSWDLKNGLEHNNCLKCFFEMKNVLNQQADKYMTKFGVVPTFKAGIHYGEVTTGEIGVIKKDIAFSGDVLNTTARIQGLCNQLKVDLLVSGELLGILNLSNQFKSTSLGESALRGRDKSIKLFTISNV